MRAEGSVPGAMTGQRAAPGAVPGLGDPGPEQASGNRASDGRASGAGPSGDKASDDKASDGKASGDKASGDRVSAYRAGDPLPPLEIEITRTLIVAGAIASRDYQDVHHDVELARAKGSPDIFMNILTTNGLVGRYVTDHFGPTAVLRAVAIRLGAPNHPGDTMLLTGSIEKVEGETVTVRILGTNKIGRHVMGTVTVTVDAPGEGGAS